MRRCGTCSLLVVTSHSSPDLLHKHLRQNVLVVVRQERAARARFQMADALDGFLHFIHTRCRARGDLGEPPFAQSIEVLVDDLVFECFLAIGPLQLEQQALAQIARADAGRMKALDDL